MDVADVHEGDAHARAVADLARYGMAKKPTNPHDGLFKEVWSRTDEAKDFLARYLPAEVVTLLDLDTLTCTRDSFVDEDLRPHYSELLYQMQRKDGGRAYAYVLAEHKSSPDRDTAFQVLRYLTRIWEHLWREGIRPLPALVTVVLYHGREPWPYGQSLREALDLPAGLAPYAPDVHYALCDLSNVPDEQIRGTVMLRAAMLLMKHIADPDLVDRLPGIIGLWRDLISEESALASLMILLRYVARAGQGVTRDDLRRVLNTTLPTEEETLMSTIAEQWVQEGKEQGRAEGVVRGQAQLLLRLLEFRFGPVPDAYRERIDQADADTLLAWGERIVTAQSLGEVFDERP
jgi:predicted transposase/invertase (TIGR01784 family)